MGQSPILLKKTPITETRSLQYNILSAVVAATCETPDDGYLAWSEDSNMMPQGQSLREPLERKMSMPRPKQIIKIGTWNVRTMFQVGKSRQVTNKMDNYSLDILGISEVRWTGFGNGKLKTSDDMKEVLLLFSVKQPPRV